MQKYHTRRRDPPIANGENGPPERTVTPQATLQDANDRQVVEGDKKPKTLNPHQILPRAMLIRVFSGTHSTDEMQSAAERVAKGFPWMPLANAIKDINSSVL